MNVACPGWPARTSKNVRPLASVTGEEPFAGMTLSPPRVDTRETNLPTTGTPPASRTVTVICVPKNSEPDCSAEATVVLDGLGTPGPVGRPAGRAAPGSGPGSGDATFETARSLPPLASACTANA